MVRRRWSVVALAVAMAFLASASMAAEGDSPFKRRIKVSEFPEGLTWLNTSRPLQLQELRGKFVLLDFWTYCCINCMHILPELKKAERAYAQELVVIGVHSAKFETEQDTKNIREAILRYEIEHPVVNDADHVFWKRFQATGWPTLMLIDPEGYLVWGTSGEITFEQLDKVLRAGVDFYRGRGLIDNRPLRFDLEARHAATTPLRFPGKILADEAGGRLFIADSNHNRIVVAQLDGTLLATIGSGAPGRNDGDYASARFDHPQGMVLKDRTLYVADTENHLLRKVDLQAQQVSTIAGVGQQGRKVPRFGTLGKPLQTPLNSPWDLWIHKDQLYIAMAGPHQIWRMPLDESGIGPYAGNGREDIVDGPLLPPQPYEEGYASFAQPSGLAGDGQLLYVADSEGSSIRAVPLSPGGDVTTLVGTSHLPQGRLFVFGDVDGDRETARLQHPLGIVHLAGKLYVADTYNNKIKVVDPAEGVTRTLAGTGEAGAADGAEASFDEPAGISTAGGKLYVADTNNHAIRVIDLGAGPQVSTLVIRGLAPPTRPAAK